MTLNIRAGSSCRRSEHSRCFPLSPANQFPVLSSGWLVLGLCQGHLWPLLVPPEGALGTGAGRGGDLASCSSFVHCFCHCCSNSGTSSCPGGSCWLLSPRPGLASSRLFRGIPASSIWASPQLGGLCPRSVGQGPPPRFQLRRCPALPIVPLAVGVVSDSCYDFLLCVDVPRPFFPLSALHYLCDQFPMLNSLC